MYQTWYCLLGICYLTVKFWSIYYVFRSSWGFWEVHPHETFTEKISFIALSVQIFPIWLLLCKYCPEIHRSSFLSKVFFKSILIFIIFCFEKEECNWYCFHMFSKSYFLLRKTYISSIFLKVIKISKLFKNLLTFNTVTSFENNENDIEEQIYT